MERMGNKSGFFERNKLLLAIVITAFVSGSFVYFSLRPSELTGYFTGIEGETSPLELKMVTKVIDGDTVIAEGESVRLLGIDADERGYPCYSAARKKLEELVLNKEVYLEKGKTDKDQYGRYLRYIFLDEQNINLQLVEEGVAVARFSPENVKYKKEIIDAERQARNDRKGCKWRGSEQEQQETQQPAQPEQEYKWSKLTSAATGLDVIDACNAGNYIGKERIVEGKVADSYKYKAASIFLNFEKPYPNQCFTALIWSSDWERFPEKAENYYRGKTVRVKGEIEEYKGKPEIILRDISQIEVGG